MITDQDLATAPPKPSHKLLLSILGEMGSAISALWDTDDQGRITNPCPACRLPAWQCQDETHVPVPNDLRLKGEVRGIEWTDEAGRYHRLEDEYLAEAGLENERIYYSPDRDPSGEHGGGGEWLGSEFYVTPGEYIKHHGAILMSKATSKKDRRMFLEMCRRLDRAEALMNLVVTVPREDFIPLMSACRPIPTWLPYDTTA